jgi:glycine/D-amino acid oxidase-like deaminating enzyme
VTAGGGSGLEAVLWADGASSVIPAATGATCPPLQGDTAADLAIVGGGLTGLVTSIAVRDRWPGRRIVLLEAGACGSGASGRNAGMAVGGCSIELDALEALLGTAGARRSAAWLAEGPRLVAAMARRVGAAGAVEETGTLALARTARQERWQRSLATVYARLGVEAEVLDAAAVRREVASPLYRSGFHVRAGHLLVDPLRLVVALRAAALAAGVVVHENTPVTGVTEGQVLRLATPGGTVSAPAMVLATNAYSPRLGFFRNRVAPVHVACVATAPLAPPTRAALGWARRQALWEEGRVYHFFRLTPDDRVLIGGGGAAYHAGDGLVHDGTRDFERLGAALRRIFPVLEGVAITHAWSGPVAFARDFLPSIGVTGAARNIYHALGYSGSGVALSHLAARLVCDLYSGEPVDEGGRFLVDRRFPTLLAGPLKWAAIHAVRNGWMALDRFGW